MSNELYSIGVSALSTAYTQLRTAGNNISNASTPGYTRESVTQSAIVDSFVGSNYLGQGVQVDQVTRNYNQFLTQQANQSTAASAAATQQAQDLSQVDSLFSNQTTGIGAALGNFFSAAQTLTQTPADPAARQALLSSGQALVQSFNSAGASLQQMQASSTQALTAEVGTVNQLATQIASLNSQIALAQGTGGSPNQLLDQRDALVRTLNQSIRVADVPQGDGTTNLFLGNGQPLVVGGTASAVGVAQDPVDPQNVEIGIKSANGSLIPIQASQVGGGKIGAMLQFQQQDLPAIQNAIGRLAVVASDQVNTQQALGQDLNGAAGTNFFAAPSATVVAATSNTGGATITASLTNTSQLQASDYRLDYSGGQYSLTRLTDGTKTTSATMPISVDGFTLNATGAPANGDIFTIEPVRAGSTNIATALTDPSAIAAASPVAVTPGAANTGSLAVSDLSVVGPTRNANLTQGVTINFTGPATYTYTTGGVTSASQTYTAGQPIQINGWSLTASGTPAAGDSLGIAANVGGTGDNRNAIKLAQLASQNLVANGTLAGGYAATVATVGGLAQSANTAQTAQAQGLQAALTSESSVAGVNLDEEATKLIQFQQQYQAAAKIITTANTVFDTILNLGG